MNKYFYNFPIKLKIKRVFPLEKNDKFTKNHIF